MEAQLEYDAAMLSENDPELISYEVRPVSRPRPWHVRRLAIAAVAGLAIVAAAALLAEPLDRPRAEGKKLLKGLPSAVTMLTATDTCENFAYLTVKKIKHNNLGNKGPGHGKEGIIYEIESHEVGGNLKSYELHLNAESDYHPQWPSENGLHYDAFMSINLKPCTEATVKFTITESDKKIPVPIKEASFTFYDLDTHKKGNQESIEVSGYTEAVSREDTTLKITDNGVSTTFTATEEGDGGDNPTNPKSLTELQLRRAFTVKFKELSQWHVKFASTCPDNTHGRRFDLVGLPALECAAGADPDKVKTTLPTCCLIKVKAINFGLACEEAAKKSFYHFMC